MKTREYKRDLMEHAHKKLKVVAQRFVLGGMGPASAAYAAIRETKVLFPLDWHLGVQGDDDDEFVEVWEVDHKSTIPIATITR